MKRNNLRQKRRRDEYSDLPTITNLRPRVPIRKMYWEFHKGDNDYNPSMPHGHSLEGGSLDGKYKLKLWSGEIYEVKTGKHVFTAKKKDMQRLYNCRGFREFVAECRKEYMARHPGMELLPLAKNGYVKTIQSRKRYKNKSGIPEIRFCLELRVEKMTTR